MFSLSWFGLLKTQWWLHPDEVETRSAVAAIVDVNQSSIADTNFQRT
jgi:hypothetical protein